jgi:2,4-dienoyl-CoA reductase-like NADH-dependent reductase (Old Yellow Enzyme family)
MSTAESPLLLSDETASVRLFTPLKIRSIKLANRIAVSPMCQYSCEDGFANDWHLVHLGSRAIGGAGLIIAEASAVEGRGRISPWDLGIWKDEHIAPLEKISRFLKEHGAVPAIQLAHAGRKASTDVPWRGGNPVPPEGGGWQPVAPSPIPFANGYPMPLELSKAEIKVIVQAFASAAKRALKAGFEVIELHGAHGYLTHEFLSPLSNQRQDEYGGSLENRVRFPLEVIEAVRDVWPDNLPLFFRISATDWVSGGWTEDDSVQLARAAKSRGVDVIDCSSGGSAAQASIPSEPGYQVPFSEQIRREAGIMTAAVGLITEPRQAERIIENEQADLVLLAREFLREPYWPLKAARSLGVPLSPAVQYQRAFPRIAKP